MKFQSQSAIKVFHFVVLTGRWVSFQGPCDEVPVPERHQIHGAAQCLGLGGPCRTDEEEKGTSFVFSIPFP